MSFTGLGFRIFGLPWENSGAYGWAIGSRVILTSDVLDVAREFESVCDTVVIQKNRYPHEADHKREYEVWPHEAIDLDMDPSDHDLESIEVLGLTDRLGAKPVIVATFGRKRPATVFIDDEMIQESPAWNSDPGESQYDYLNRVSQVANRVLVSISRSGHRTLSFQRRNALVYNTLSVLVFAAWVYTAVRLWPNWITPALLLLMVVPLQSLRGRIDEPMRRYFGLTEDNYSSHVIVRAQTRQEWRKQRFNSKRDAIVALITFFGTLIIALITYVLGVK